MAERDQGKRGAAAVGSIEAGIWPRPRAGAGGPFCSVRHAVTRCRGVIGHGGGVAPAGGWGLGSQITGSSAFGWPATAASAGSGLFWAPVKLSPIESTG